MPERNRIGDAFAAALEQMLKETPGRTISDAAKQLGVSRQAFHAYLNGNLPRRKTLNRAMHLWNLKIDLREHSFDKEAFGANQGEIEEQVSQPAQLALWEMLDAVSEKD